MFRCTEQSDCDPLAQFCLSLRSDSQHSVFTKVEQRNETPELNKINGVTKYMCIVIFHNNHTEIIAMLRSYFKVAV